MDKKFNRELENSIKSRRLYIGGTMVLDPDFDIKNYLQDVQKQVELEKINLKLKKNFPHIKINSTPFITEKNSSNFNTINHDNDILNHQNNNKIYSKEIKNEKKPLATLNNLLSLSKDNLFNSISNSKRSSTIDTDINIQKKLFEANNSIRSTQKKIERIIKKNKNGTKSSYSIFQNRNNDMIITNEPSYNIMKEIKEIKKREKSFSSINNENEKNLKRNFKSFDYEKFYNNLNNFKNNKNIIVFDRRHENEVFEPIKILNNYKMQKQIQINPEEKYLHNFNTKNKQLTINSVLLKLINNESNKLYKDYSKKSNKFYSNKRTIESNEADFEEYKETQKKACYQIDTLLLKIQKKNKELETENLNCKLEIKLIEDEMRRILQQIEYLRIYAKFVNEVLGGDTTRFTQKIFPEQKYDDEINIEELSKDVVNTYKCFYDDINQEVFKVEETFINDPEKMWYKFKEIEGIIGRDLYTKEITLGEIKKLEEENNNNLKDLRQKYQMLQDEINSLNDKKDYELNKLKEVEKRYNYQKNEFDDIIKDFYIYVNNNLNKENIIIDSKKIYNKLEPSDCIKQIYNIICEKEIYIDKLMLNLKNWEKIDKIFFEEIVGKRKKEVKHLKQLKIFKKKMNEKIQFMNNIESGKNKLFIFWRKTEPPYHKPKKIVEEKVDEKLIEEMENEELLKYEDNDE